MKLINNVIEIELDKLEPNHWNPNQQSAFIYDKELNSIDTFGFIDPILIREIEDGKFQIVDGEHRWKAMKEKGAKTISAINMGKVDDVVAMQLTIITNETRGRTDRVKLVELLDSLKSETEVQQLYDNLPYEKAELDALLKESDIDWDQIDAEMNNIKGDSSTNMPDGEPPNDDDLMTSYYKQFLKLYSLEESDFSLSAFATGWRTKEV